jgi:hypothetical protein
VPIPTFPEAAHPIIKSLFHYSDRELLTLFQRYPDSGQYFTALYCRYSPMVYTLIQHSARSPVQSDYLFALIWRHVFHEMNGVDLRAFNEGGTSFQGWLLSVTASGINEAVLPPVEGIHYNLKTAPPPLWCYLDRALEQLPPATRLMILMSRTFQWSETRISAYLHAEGEQISAEHVKLHLQEGDRLLEANLPEDIREIYLDGNAREEGSEAHPVFDSFTQSLEELEFF